MKRINLLPKIKQRELAFEQTLYSVRVAVIFAVIILLFGVVVQFGVWVYLNRKIKFNEAQIEQYKLLANKSENASVKEQILKANSQITDFATLSAKTPKWSSVLAVFVHNVPIGVKIISFEANSAKQEINISGFSPSRDLVIDLYNNINADKEHFKNINYPLENVTRPNNVMFHFTFTIADGILIGKAK